MLLTIVFFTLKSTSFNLINIEPPIKDLSGRCLVMDQIVEEGFDEIREGDLIGIDRIRLGILAHRTRKRIPQCMHPVLCLSTTTAGLNSKKGNGVPLSEGERELYLKMQKCARGAIREFCMPDSHQADKD
ncbi:MAG: hypothetical protein V1936_05165 [Patescibacteria group bacterium]